MRVNEFEKQMQQKMDELQLRPSGKVWEEVGKRIRKEKKRRIVFYWLLLLAILLGGGTTWFIISTGKSDHTTITEKQTIPVDQVNNSKKNTRSLLNETEPSDHINNDKIPGKKPVNSTTIYPDTKKPLKIRKTGYNVDAILITGNSGSKQKKENEETTITNEEIISIAISAGEKKKNNQDEKPVETNTRSVISDKTTDPDPKVAESKVNEPTEKKETKEPVLTDTAVSIVQDLVVLHPDSTLKTEETKTTVVSKKKNKWHWGVDVQSGVSNIVQGEIFGSRKSADVLFTTPSANTRNAGVPFAPPVLIESPQPGFSFDLGLFAQKSFSKKLDIRTGLHYSYISTRVKVGNKVEATREINNNFSSSVTVKSYYRANAAGQLYANQYNLLGLSASLSWHVVNKKKFSMNWDNSFTFSRLISTNALLYDGNLRGYYKDFNAFQKSQLFISTAVSIPVLKKNKFILSVNPVLSYGLTPVLKHSNSGNSHFINYGIGFKLLGRRHY